MKRRDTLLLAALFLVGATAHGTWADSKDQSKLPMSDDAQAAGSETAPAPSGGSENQDSAAPDSATPGGEDDTLPDDMSLGEVPEITAIELTDDLARRAIDAYAMVKEKYRDSPLEEFENLQDFVDKAPEGKAFETDIKSFKFQNVTDWNNAITAVGFAYSALTDDQSDDVRAQIEDLKKDNSVAQDMKDRMLLSLQAMIPSENNKNILSAIAADPAYAEKLKLLDEEE